MSEAVSSDLKVQDRTKENETAYAVEFKDGAGLVYYDERPVCTFLVQDERQWRRLVKSDPYQLARAFILSEFDVDGDLIAAIKIFRQQFLAHSTPGWKTIATALWDRLQQQFRMGSSADDIRFHYDRSNDFYRCFLDSRLVYSCAYFRNPDMTLDRAQVDKLEHICRKLQLRPGDRFLDVGCGWGALALHSADRYGTFSTGCTLSPNQLAWANAESERTGLIDRVSFVRRDYRELSGTFDRIASVGMFEHVGHRALDAYFSTVFRLLADNGLFLNHGIVRPTTTLIGPETAFLSRYVFPGGELVRLIDVIRFAEKAGFEVLDAENLRPHYALTCKIWVDRLIRNKTECLQQVNIQTYRTWLLYLAASSASFDSGETEIHQVLFAKRGAARPLTRDYMYV